MFLYSGFKDYGADILDYTVVAHFKLPHLGLYCFAKSLGLEATDAQFVCIQVILV